MWTKTAASLKMSSMTKLQIVLLLSTFLLQNCVNKELPPPPEAPAEPLEAPSLPIQVGAERMATYLSLLQGKRIGLVVNQTSQVQRFSTTADRVPAINNGHTSVHLIDTLQALGLDLVKIFALEHGFRGTADAGDYIEDGRDTRSGLPIVTLYGRSKSPTAADLADLDIILFDIQDVGARFYTYISSLHYIMDAAAAYQTPIMILDRPNPNGHYIDGPILAPAYQSFVGMHPVPVVHGMTIGEYGLMINGEGWLTNGRQATLTVIPCANYQRNMAYDLPVPPSPNLPNQRAILLYPSLCLLEATVVSVGRGTTTQFQVFGHPDLSFGNYQFTPQPGPGSRHPKLQGQLCNGRSLLDRSPAEIHAEGKLNLRYLLESYRAFQGSESIDRPEFFDQLAGTNKLRLQLAEGATEDEIRSDWQAGLTAFAQRRQPYLIYPE